MLQVEGPGIVQRGRSSPLQHGDLPRGSPTGLEPLPGHRRPQNLSSGPVVGWIHWIQETLRKPGDRVGRVSGPAPLRCPRSRISGREGFRYGEFRPLRIPLEGVIVVVGIPLILWAWPLGGRGVGQVQA